MFPVLKIPTNIYRRHFLKLQETQPNIICEYHLPKNKLNTILSDNLLTIDTDFSAKITVRKSRQRF